MGIDLGGDAGGAGPDAELELEDEEDESDDDEEEEDGDDEVLDADLPEVAWKLPALSILKRSQSREVDPRMVAAGGEVLEATLREFGVDARLIGATVGPTVTRYELELAPGVKVNKVTGLAKEIAYSMASHGSCMLWPWRLKASSPTSIKRTTKGDGGTRSFKRPSATASFCTTMRAVSPACAITLGKITFTTTGEAPSGAKRVAR